MIAASTPMVHRRRRRIFSETCLSPATETVHHREAHASSGGPHERSDFVGRTSEEANVLSSQDRPHTARVATVARFRQERQCENRDGNRLPNLPVGASARSQQGHQHRAK